MGERKGIMLAKPFESRLFAQMRRAIVQPKINGQRCRAVFEGQTYVLYSSQGNKIISLPHIIHELNDGFACIGETFDGEIYLPGVKVQDISGICRTQHVVAAGASLQFHVFDTIDYTESQFWRLVLLRNYTFPPSIIPVQGIQITTEEQFFSYAKSFVAEGYEGAIVRDLDAQYTEGKCNNMLKYKPLKTDRYKVISFQEECDIYGFPKKTLGAIWLEDKQGNMFKVGTGTLLTQAKRQEIWDNQSAFRNLFAIIEYPELTKRGVPHQPRITGFSTQGEVEGEDC